MPQAECVSGQWVVNGDVNVTSQNVTVSEPIVIIGSFTQDANSTLTIVLGSGTSAQPFLNVSGMHS